MLVTLETMDPLCPSGPLTTDLEHMYLGRNGSVSAIPQHNDGTCGAKMTSKIPGSLRFGNNAWQASH